MSKVNYSYNELYNMARALTLAVTGKELYNKDITDAQADEAVGLLRSWFDVHDSRVEYDEQQRLCPNCKVPKSDGNGCHMAI
jgi:hypothetical protein